VGGLRATVCTAAITSLIGCQIYARGSTGLPKKTIRHGEPTLRTDQLPGAGELLPDGRVRYIVATAELCQAPKLVDEQFVMSPAVTPGGIALYVGGGVVLAGGVGLIATSVLGKQQVGSNNNQKRVEAVIGVSALIVGAVLTGLVAAKGRKEKRELTSAADKGPVTSRPDGVEDVACKDVAAELGPLELTTPWGTTSQATPDATGAVTFEVAWVGEQLDPDAPTAESLIAAPWKVASTKAKLSTTWQPLGPQLPQALEIARAAKKKPKKPE
jgi:hypothetical protein